MARSPSRATVLVGQWVRLPHEDLARTRSTPGHSTIASLRRGPPDVPAPDSVRVPQHGQQMVVLLDGKRFEPALPAVAARVVIGVIPSNMRRQQPVHPSTEIPIVVWPESQMKMIGHETVRQDTHRNTLRRVVKQIKERLIIAVRMKYLSPGIAPIDDVITMVPDRRPRCAWHVIALLNSTHAAAQ